VAQGATALAGWGIIMLAADGALGLPLSPRSPLFGLNPGVPGYHGCLAVPPWASEVVRGES